MSKQHKYTNDTNKRQKVYTDGVTGPFRILEPGDSCTVRLDADQEMRVLEVAPESKKKPAKK